MTVDAWPVPSDAAPVPERWRDRLARYARAVLRPMDPEKAAALARTRAGLPEALRGGKQALGRQSPGCTATHNVVERCNFSCSACYLANTANQTPPLPFEEVRAQLDAVRAAIGPDGPVQITAGEVTLLPVEELARIVRYARSIGLVPMVMTHGETFRDDPSYLPRLMREGGLDRVAIHVDTTQHGRRGLRKGHREADIHFIREEMAEIVRRARATTGRRLHAAHTFTVTRDNLSGVGDVVRWTLEHADVFRMLSLQPTADVGRTRTNALAGSGLAREALWTEVERGAGGPLNRHTIYFGHPRCNYLTMAFVVRFDGELHVVEVAREGAPVDEAFARRLFEGGFAGFDADADDWTEGALRLLSTLARDPRSLAEWPAYGLYRSWTERAWWPRLVRAAARGRPWSIHPFMLVVHHFMSRDELDTPEGRERLAACSFKVPVDGRMVSMCEMNGTELRRTTNLAVQGRLGGRRGALEGQP